LLYAPLPLAGCWPPIVPNVRPHATTNRGILKMRITLRYAEPHFRGALFTLLCASKFATRHRLNNHTLNKCKNLSCWRCL
jgi:hypothetical protein